MYGNSSTPFFSYLYMVYDYFTLISGLLKNPLPGNISHQKMLPSGRTLHPLPLQNSKIKKSSVLLLLFEEENDLNVCLIKRPAHMKHHAGQVAFPGGKIENYETPLHTALRETTEEIGVTPDSVKIAGSLSEVYINVSNFLVLPFIGWTDSKPEWKINKQEVEKVFSFPILKFGNKKEYSLVSTTTGTMEVPCFRFENEIIWGATAMIIQEFTDLITSNFNENNPSL